MQQGRAKLLFSFHLLLRVKAKQEFSTPNALRTKTAFLVKIRAGAREVFTERVFLVFRAIC